MKRCLLNPYTFQVFNIFFFWTTVYALFHAVLFHFLCKFSVVYHKSSKKETATSRRKISKISPVYCAFLHAHENDLLFLYLTFVPLSISKIKWAAFFPPEEPWLCHDEMFQVSQKEPNLHFLLPLFKVVLLSWRKWMSSCF